MAVTGRLRTQEPVRHDFVVVTHRLPTWHAVDGRDTSHWHPGRDDLSIPLQPVVAERHGTWVGWPGPGKGRVDRFDWNGMALQPVLLSPADISDHLDGQCGTTIAPLYHDGIEPPEFRRRWRQAYLRVNEHYARVTADTAAAGGVVWIHGHQLQLVPAMLRTLRPDLLIGFFLHEPFPPAELFVKLPLRRDIIHGLLGADLVGVQEPRAAANLLRLAADLGGLPVQGNTVMVGDRSTTVDAFPMSIDSAAIEERAGTAHIRARAAAIRIQLSNPRTILLAIDRPDPANGIEQRLNAYHELLEEGRLDPATTVLIQVAVPTRVRETRHCATRDTVERKIAQINGVHSWITRPAVHYLYQTLELDELIALYLSADVMLATPLRSGMDLTAKEFVACRTDNSGTLILSEFTATANDFSQAIMVNPYDTDALKAAILDACGEPGAEARRDDMRTMRQHVHQYDVHRWAGGFLGMLGGCVSQYMPQPRLPRLVASA